MHFVLCALVLIGTAGASTAHAQLGDDRPSGTIALEARDAILATTLLDVALSTRDRVEAAANPRWQGGILMDDAVRSTLRFGSDDARDAAGELSDVLLYGLIAAPMIDSVASFATSTTSAQQASQMLIADAQAFAITTLVVQLAKWGAARARPYTLTCDQDSTDPHCAPAAGSRNESFLSGHSAMAFTGAGLVCAHRSFTRMYGETADATTCLSSIALAATTAAMRVAADKHYATDVLAGAAVGLLSGYLLPSLTLTAKRDRDRGVRGAMVASIAPMAFRDGAGFTVNGLF